MDERDVIATLCKLEEMDRDAVAGYQDAIAKTSDPEVRDQLDEFRKDHARHVQAIGETLRRQGWPHAKVTREFEALMQGFRRQVDMAEGGDDAVMLAMDLGEKATNAEYAEALRLDVDDDVRQVLEADFADERRHLAFVEQHMPSQFGGGMAHVSRGGGSLAAGSADTSSEQSRPRGGLNADVRKRQESKGSEMAGGGTGAHEEHPNFGGQVEGDSGSSGSGVAGSGSGD